MSFAAQYLQKHAPGQALISNPPAAGLKSIITIPAYRESGLHRCLDSLYNMDPISDLTEIIILFNMPEGAHPETRALHEASIKQAGTFKSSQPPPKNLTLHLVTLDDLPKKHFGAGLARKLAMDEATRRFNMIGNPGGIILSLDADTVVEPNYVAAISKLFAENPTTEGCSIHFEHPLNNKAIPRKEKHEDASGAPHNGDLEEKTGQAYTGGDTGAGDAAYSETVYQAITNYELHQRYYLMATRYTGYPYAYHTVGSAFAVRSGAYARYGGMSRRQAGEDFYFIQKVAVNGRFGECNTTTVYPSPRTSNRVPFGTGPDIARQIQRSGEAYLTFNPALFMMLREFYSRGVGLYAAARQKEGLTEDLKKDLSEDSGYYLEKGSRGNLKSGKHAKDPNELEAELKKQLQASVIKKFEEKLHPLLVEYLERSNYRDRLDEIFSNVASEQAFQQRFSRNFNWLWLLKFLHYGEQNGFGKVALEEALQQLLTKLQIDYPSGSLKDLLLYLRRMQKNRKHISP